MILQTSEMEPTDIYKVMSQTVIPRPVAWIVTEDKGIVNVAPFSYFIPLSSKPPVLLVSIGHKPDGTPKDTLFNLRKHKRCTICLAEPAFMEALHRTSAPLEHHESEAVRFDIKTEILWKDFPPAIKGVPVAYACRYKEEIDLGGKTVPTLVDVEKIWLRDDIVKDTSRLAIDFDPLVRIGKVYATLGRYLEPPSI